MPPAEAAHNKQNKPRGHSPAPGQPPAFELCPVEVRRGQSQLKVPLSFSLSYVHTEYEI